MGVRGGQEGGSAPFALGFSLPLNERASCSPDFSIQLHGEDRQDTRFLGQNPRVRNCASEETGLGGILADSLLTHLMRRDPATGWRVPREPGQYVAFAGLKGLFRGWLSFPETGFQPGST